MEEINLNELFYYYLKKLPIIIVVTVLALILGYLYTKEVQVPMYHGTTTIILVQKQGDNDNSTVTQNEITVNEKLVSTYSQIIKSRRVLDQVIDDLELDMKAGSLSENITVTSVSDTSIIKVTVSDEDKEQAVEIANKVSEVFKNEITEIYNLENVSVVDEAIVENEPYNINLLKQLVICALAGIVLSCGLIFVMFYFDNTIKNKNEIESKLNLPVLGEIPTAKKLTNNKRKFKKKKRVSNEDIKAKDIKDEVFDNVDKDILVDDVSSEKKTTKVTNTEKKSNKASVEKKTTAKKKAVTKKNTIKNKKGEGEK